MATGLQIQTAMMSLYNYNILRVNDKLVYRDRGTGEWYVAPEGDVAALADFITEREERIAQAREEATRTYDDEACEIIGDAIVPYPYDW